MENPPLQTEYSVHHNFATTKELTEHVEKWKEFLAWKQKKATKKEGDMRGQHIKDLHASARLFHEMNPSVVYRDCLKLCSKKD